MSRRKIYRYGLLQCDRRRRYIKIESLGKVQSRMSEYADVFKKSIDRA